MWMTQAHVEPPPILPINSKSNGKSDKYIVKLRLCRDPTSGTSDLYEFKMSLFDNGDPEDYLSLMKNFNMTLVVSGTLETGAKVQ